MTWVSIRLKNPSSDTRILCWESEVEFWLRLVEGLNYEGISVEY